MDRATTSGFRAISDLPPIIAVCPRCGTHLRLTRTPVEFTLIQCFSCQAKFCLEPIETAPVDPQLPAPLAVTEALPGSRNANPETTLPPLTLPPAAAPAAPTLTFSVPPPPLPTPPAPKTKSNTASATITPQAKASSSFSVGPPPAPSQAANPSAAPGLPLPNEAAKKPQLLLDLGPLESIIAVSVTLALVGGGIFAGYYAIRSLAPAAPPQSSAPVADAKSPSLDGSLQHVMNAGPITIPALPAAPLESAATTGALVGYWVSRADDGSVAVLDLREDGIAVYTGAAHDPTQAAGLRGRWALTEQERNVATVDILYTATGLEMHRLKIEIASPDCITVIQSAFRGVVERPAQRFVRHARPAT